MDWTASIGSSPHGSLRLGAENGHALRHGGVQTDVPRCCRGGDLDLLDRIAGLGALTRLDISVGGRVFRDNRAIGEICRRRGIDAVRLGALALLPLVAALAGRASAETPPDTLQGEAAFARDCGTCHVMSATPSPRQGPNLYGVVGRQAGKLKGFTYSKALARARFTWRRDKLDAWLTDSAKLVPGSVMPYRQADPALRAAIIDYLEAASAAAK